MRNRGLAWTAELARIRADRAAHPEIREERLRLSPSPLIGLSAWRGASGRRYVVQVLTLAQAQTEAEHEPHGAVILGVRRPTEGLARIVGAGWRGPLAEAVGIARADGATEIHLHRLAVDDAEREAIVEDLVGDDAL